ncbi:MAG: iron chelate uptake ABC transporter family permease subunit, partial [Pseudoclavibacter sp.]
MSVETRVENPPESALETTHARRPRGKTQRGTVPSAHTPRADAPTRTTVELVAEGRRLRGRRRRLVIVVLAIVVVVGFACSVMLGDRIYGPVDVWRVMIGEELAVATGLCFGLAGVTFQTMLRNPLASPDIIGISTGASAAAAIAIVMFGLGGAAVSGVAVVSGLVVAIVIYLLAFRRGGVGTRLILIGIGIAAMLESVI